MGKNPYHPLCCAHQNVHTTASFLVSSKAQPILELNNDLKIFHFTKMETEAKRGEEVE